MLRYTTFFLLVLTTTLNAQDLTVMTYNIRYATERDGDNQWENRKKMLVDQIKFYEPKVFGIQEGLLSQVSYLDEALEDYAYVGVGRDDGKTKGEFSAIFYRKHELDTLTQGTFWLSQDPLRPSVGWDAAMERVCTYAKFKYENNTLWVFNTHFDHMGEKAREESAKLILRQIKRLNNDSDPVVLMGDFNATVADAPIKVILDDMKDTFVSTTNAYGAPTTFNGFSLEYDRDRRIDFVFHSDNVTCLKTAILSQVMDGRFPSDHFPVISYLRLNN
ncbi:MAG: endonuclease/exonuclease/phosphatase family protein [Cyclobacteriaceae bacterium]